jgi:hypothetical protein
MSALERQLIRLRLRTDLSTFIHRTFQTVAPAQPYLYNWHIDAMAWHLEQMRDRRHQTPGDYASTSPRKIHLRFGRVSGVGFGSGSVKADHLRQLFRESGR